MSANKCLKLISDGEIEIVKITPDLYDQTVELYQNSFMKYENVAIACELLESQEVIDEMECLIRTLLKDQISFAARDVKTKELVGMCVSTVLNPSSKITHDDVFDWFKTENMRAVGKYLDCVEYSYDILKEWQIDCVIDMTFLATRRKYARRGIALSLVEYLIEYAEKYSNGCKEIIAELPQVICDQRPQAIQTALTSYFSQRVGEKAGFETLFKVENTKFEFRGKTFAEKIDPIHKYAVFAARRL